MKLIEHVLRVLKSLWQNVGTRLLIMFLFLLAPVGHIMYPSTISFNDVLFLDLFFLFGMILALTLLVIDDMRFTKMLEYLEEGNQK